MQDFQRSGAKAADKQRQPIEPIYPPDDLNLDMQVKPLLEEEAESSGPLEEDTEGQPEETRPWRHLQSQSCRDRPYGVGRSEKDGRLSRASGSEAVGQMACEAAFQADLS